MKENSIEEDMKILEGIIKGDEDCINTIYSQMKVKNDNDEDIQYYKKEIQSIKNIVDNYLKEKARADKLEKEYSAMLTESDENECDYKRVLKENEIYKKNSEIMSKENLSTAEQLKVEIKENFRLKNQLENNRKEYQETYKDVREELKELKKENEKLKNQETTARKINELLVQRYSNSIPVQKVKDKIEEYKNMLKTCNKAKDIDRVKAINERILELQELLEGRK